MKRNSRYEKAMSYNEKYLKNSPNEDGYIKFTMTPETQYYANQQYLIGYNDALNDNFDAIMGHHDDTNYHDMYEKAMEMAMCLQKNRNELIKEIESLKRRLGDID